MVVWTWGRLHFLDPPPPPPPLRDPETMNRITGQFSINLSLFAPHHGFYPPSPPSTVQYISGYCFSFVEKTSPDVPRRPSRYCLVIIRILSGASNGIVSSSSGSCLGHPKVLSCHHPDPVWSIRILSRTSKGIVSSSSRSCREHPKVLSCP